MNRLTQTRLSLAFGLALLAASAMPAFGQDDCRGWARSCASVDLRVDGEHLVLFTPNATAEEPVEPTEGSDRLTIVPTDVDSEPFATTEAGTTGSYDMYGGRGNTRCEDDEPLPVGAGEPDEAEEDENCGATGAVFLLALPASIFAFAPGDDGDSFTVDGPTSAPVAGPGEPVSGDGGGGQSDGGAGGTAADDSGSSDSGNAGDSGNNTGATTAGAGDNGGNNESGNTGSTGDTGGSTGNTGGTTGGAGDDWGPFHPTADPPAPATPSAGDIPPISQVPEPISTTLFGLGLAGYAGVQARRRRKLGVTEDI